jgi:hypothetical protein
MKTDIAHAKEMHDLSPMFNTFSTIKPENYKMELKSY